MSWAGVPLTRALPRRRRSSPWSSPGGPCRASCPAPPSTTRPPCAARERHRSAWLEPRTLLIGVVVFAAAFTEGTANDWLAVAFVEGHELPAWAGVLAFATFLTFMTLGRIAGTGLLDRYGRVPVLRVSFALAAVGAALVILGSPWVAFVGTAVWGVGAALGFPVGMSASADDAERAAARMSVVATIGYVAFLAGPPVLGPARRPGRRAALAARRRGARRPGPRGRPRRAREASRAEVTPALTPR